jgi:hypothetical protein
MGQGNNPKGKGSRAESEAQGEKGESQTKGAKKAQGTGA